jgi:hypothetical protein
MPIHPTNQEPSGQVASPEGNSLGWGSPAQFKDGASHRVHPAQGACLDRAASCRECGGGTSRGRGSRTPFKGDARHGDLRGQ